ncbi:hypothetical protein DE146DRAFT_134764 [Phaeosphaeria sp. MPI-PUGE-AT-0046c]|nr:hypothetical protein DE146DRAFT_134764 [Phaeosphaeria sp. MPI-PUGE-AT-0046c]
MRLSAADLANMLAIWQFAVARLEHSRLRCGILRLDGADVKLWGGAPAASLPAPTAQLPSDPRHENDEACSRHKRRDSTHAE